MTIQARKSIVVGGKTLRISSPSTLACKLNIIYNPNTSDSNYSFDLVISHPLPQVPEYSTVAATDFPVFKMIQPFGSA